jgi:hypothetical protein
MVAVLPVSNLKIYLRYYNAFVYFVCFVVKIKPSAPAAALAETRGPIQAHRRP